MPTWLKDELRKIAATDDLASARRRPRHTPGVWSMSTASRHREALAERVSAKPVVKGCLREASEVATGTSR
jgi:hypothetical protein